MQIGRNSQSSPSWTLLVMNSEFSMIGPRMKPSTSGGRGMPPCFIR